MSPFLSLSLSLSLSPLTFSLFNLLFATPLSQINNFHTLSGVVNTVTRSNTSSALDQELENKRKVELALK